MNEEQALEVERRLRRLDVTLESQEEVARAVRCLCDFWKASLVGVSMKGQLGAPDWTGYELRIWELGETLRLFLRKKRLWRGRCRLLDCVAEVLREEQFGKGRQTFAVLLGDFGGGEYAEALASGLDQPEVWGHVVKAMHRAKIKGYRGKVERIAEDGKGWERRAAKSYLRHAEY